MSLKKTRQPLDDKSRDQRHRDKGARRGGIKTFSQERAHTHGNQTPDDDQNDRVLSNGGAPFAQPQVRIGIAPTLEKRSPAQRRKRGKNQPKISEIENERFATIRETQ